MTSPMVRQMLGNEAESLLARLQRIKPFSLNMPMVAAAALPASAQQAVDLHMKRVLLSVGRLPGEFLRWLESVEVQQAQDAVAQRRLTLLRLRFQAALTQFDLFSDVLTQRSEHGFGVWLAGLDVLAADALKVVGDYYDPPVAVCYLDRGIGAAIRRARTCLPGGGGNPVK